VLGLVRGGDAKAIRHVRLSTIRTQNGHRLQGEEKVHRRADIETNTIRLVTRHDTNLFKHLMYNRTPRESILLQPDHSVQPNLPTV
jgi:hypothetical protein